MNNDKTPDQEEYGIFTGAQIMRYANKKEPIVQEFLYERDVMCISSEPGVGKSIFAKQLACCLSAGVNMLDVFEVRRPYKVLYIQAEGDRAETIERLEKMTKAVPVNFDNLVHFNTPGLMLNTPEGFTWFCKEIEQTKVAYEVVIIDPLYTTVKGTLSSDEVATDYVRNLRYIRDKYNATFILLHHDAKPFVMSSGLQARSVKDLFGSIYWAAFVNSNYKLRKEKGNNIYTLEAGKGEGKGRSGKLIESMTMKMIEPMPLMYVLDESTLNDSTQAVKSVLEANRDKRYRRTELENIVGKSKPTVCRALADLKVMGVLQKIVEEGITYYKVRDENDQESK